MTPLPERHRGELLLDLLLGALRVGDEQLNALAVELLGRCGEQPVRRLIKEAADRTKRPAHRVRLLQAVRRIGRITDLALHLDLVVLAQDKHPSVRTAAADLLADLGQAQLEIVAVTSPAPVLLPPGN